MLNGTALTVSPQCHQYFSENMLVEDQGGGPELSCYYLNTMQNGVALMHDCMVYIYCHNILVPLLIWIWIHEFCLPLQITN